MGFPGVGYYNATKFAVEGFTKRLAKEVRTARHQGHHRRARAVPHRLGRPLAKDHAQAHRRIC